MDAPDELVMQPSLTTEGAWWTRGYFVPEGWWWRSDLGAAWRTHRPTKDSYLVECCSPEVAKALLRKDA